MDYTPTTTVWVKMPLELLRRRGITRRAAVLLSVIIDRCKHDRAGLSATIAADDLTAACGMSRRTMCRALQELVALDLIRTRRTGRGSVYSLTPGCVELCPKAVVDEHPQPEQRQQPRARKQQRSSSSSSAAPEEYLALVNRFKDQDEPLPGQLELKGE